MQNWLLQDINFAMLKVHAVLQQLFLWNDLLFMQRRLLLLFVHKRLQGLHQLLQYLLFIFMLCLQDWIRKDEYRNLQVRNLEYFNLEFQWLPWYFEYHD